MGVIVSIIVILHTGLFQSAGSTMDGLKIGRARARHRPSAPSVKRAIERRVGTKARA